MAYSVTPLLAAHRHSRMSPRTLFIVGLLLSVCLAGFGQKGALFLPDQEPAVPPTQPNEQETANPVIGVPEIPEEAKVQPDDESTS